MKINGKTKTYGLIGNPVEHTLSPLIQNGLAKRLGSNMVYVPFPVEPPMLQDALKGLEALGMAGANVTVPYKSQVIPYLEEVEEQAAQIGAVNTLVRGKKGYRGYNTDAPGLLRAMESLHIAVKGEHIIILGGGGAARAAAFLCAGEGAAHLYLLNRSLGKIQEISEDLKKSLHFTNITCLPMEQYADIPQGKYLAIQGTSVGLYPNSEEVIIGDMDFYKQIHTGVDVIYKPSETVFMKNVRLAGGKAFHGLKMLLYQGIIAYELWNQVQIPQEMAEEIYSEIKEALGIYE